MKSTVPMTRTLNKDVGIIKAIQGSKEDRDEALTHLFEVLKWRKMIVVYVTNHGGNADDGHEIAIETLIAFDRNIRNNKFRGGCSLKTYFYAIAKNKWFKHLDKSKRQVDLVALDVSFEELCLVIEELSDDRLKLIQKIAGLAGEKCTRIFSLVALEMSREDMAKELGLASAQGVSNALLRCRKKIRALIDQNPHWWKRINQD